MGEWHEMDCGVAGGWPHDSSLCEVKKATEVHRCKVIRDLKLIEVSFVYDDSVGQIISVNGKPWNPPKDTPPRLEPEDLDDLRNLETELRADGEIRE